MKEKRDIRLHLEEFKLKGWCVSLTSFNIETKQALQGKKDNWRPGQRKSLLLPVSKKRLLEAVAALEI